MSRWHGRKADARKVRMEQRGLIDRVRRGEPRILQAKAIRRGRQGRARGMPEGGGNGDRQVGGEAR